MKTALICMALVCMAVDGSLVGNWTAPYNFTMGLLEGAKDPDQATACYNNTVSLMTDASDIVYDIEQIFEGDFNSILRLIIDSKPFIKALTGEGGNCNFTELVEDIKPLIGANATKILTQRYLKNMMPLMQDLTDLQSGDAYKTGHAIGDAFRRFTTWDL